MQVSPDQLGGHLEKALAALYTIVGGEPLQTRESADAIRDAARKRGFAERLVFDAAPEVDWAGLRVEAGSLSLFSSRRILEVRLPGSRPGEVGVEVLTELARRPPPDTVLLLLLGKVESRQRDAAWLTALERAGVLVSARAVASTALPRWVSARARRHGIALTAEAARLLAERVEGNLLAADQELEKLALLAPDREVDVPEVLASTSDGARYDVFALVDSALAGQGARAARILEGLRAEGVQPPLLVWALARELRALASMAWGRERGESLAQVMTRHRVWEARRPAVGSALGRAGLMVWLSWLDRLAEIDRLAKGLARGDPWPELSRLVLGVAGRPLAGTPPPA
jgi:DNA polymerase-3 subunit delta